MRRSLLVVPLMLVAAPLAPLAAQVASGNAVKWGPAPPFFPAGAKFAVLQGDPSAAGEYTVRLRMPAGYVIAPHWHPTDEHVTVVSGTMLLGMGDQVDREGHAPGRRRLHLRAGPGASLRGGRRPVGGAGARDGAVRDHLRAAGGRSADGEALSAPDHDDTTRQADQARARARRRPLHGDHQHRRREDRAQDLNISLDAYGGA